MKPSGSKRPEPADLAVVNGQVWTADPARPSAEIVLVRDERIVAVGGRELRAEAARAQRRIDARGGTVLPGFVDAHVHFLQGGERLLSVQLRDATTPELFTERIAQTAAEKTPGQWITGGDWDHEHWGGDLPHRCWIDHLTTENPVWVHRLDGHMALANEMTLRLAGLLDHHVADPPGGEIVRDGDGRPTGVLKDRALDLVEAVRPRATADDDDAALDAAMRHVASHGVTSVHHMGTWRDLEVFRRNHAAGRLTTRIYAAVPLRSWERLRDEVATHGSGDDWLRIGNLKAFVDGSLGSKTAALLDPYEDSGQERGLFVETRDDLLRWLTDADAAGLQCTVHAIGDHAVRRLLDLYQEVTEANGERDRRLRMEHAQHVHPEDLHRFANLEIIASMQPYHAIDDGRWLERVVGKERAAQSYPIGALLERGTRLAFGSDWFVAPPVPLLGLDAAVRRATLDGAHPGGWFPQQRIGLEPALRAYTCDAAYASFEEHDKGTIEAGKLADLVILERPLRANAASSIRDNAVAVTIGGGRVLFEGSSGAE